LLRHDALCHIPGEPGGIRREVPGPDAKPDRRDRLPLPAEAGEAIAACLRDGRPAAAPARSVFIPIKAPHQGLTPGGVTQAVAAAARRAGLGAHRLRHSAATAMFAEGAPRQDG